MSAPVVYVFTYLGAQRGHGWLGPEPPPSCPFYGRYGYAIDAPDLQPSPDQHGQVAVHDRDGWTAVVIADRSGDPRPGSKTAIVVQQTVALGPVIALATARQPDVMARLESRGLINLGGSGVSS